MMKKKVFETSKDDDVQKFSFLERVLQSLATLQAKYTTLLLVFFLVLTLFLGFGLTKVAFESDMNNEMPQHLPIYQLNDKVSQTFGGQDAVLLLFEVDTSHNDASLSVDIRSAALMRFMLALEEKLLEESLVDEVVSPAMFFSQVPSSVLTDDFVKDMLADTSEISPFFSDDFTAAMFLIRADVGSSEEKLAQLTSVIERSIDSVPSVPGVHITITGGPSVLQTIFDYLKQDSVMTLLIAALIIFVLIFLVEQSLSKTFMIFLPLLMGILWAMGALGLLGIKISVATAGLGAMLLGLGVEYGVFMFTRYMEEREKGHNQADSLFVAVPSVGSAMLGSGLTTIVGFLALSLSIMPMLQHLGQSLALGIVFCLLAAIGFAPLIFITYERVSYHSAQKRILRLQKKVSVVKL